MRLQELILTMRVSWLVFYMNSRTTYLLTQEMCRDIKFGRRNLFGQANCFSNYMEHLSKGYSLSSAEKMSSSSDEMTGSVV